VSVAVFFHAHSDDEAIATGGTMAKLAAEGHRVVLVTATRGELGEVPPGLLAPGETLVARRDKELAASCALLGVARRENLGYRDSGMAGEETNDDPGCFWQADVQEAAKRLASILRSEDADMLTVYDERGAYGHPDHIQVHRVGIAAAEMAETPRVAMSTANRDHVAALVERASELVPAEAAADLEQRRETLRDLGVSESRITTAVDVKDFLDTKRRAMAAHESQISDTSFFLALPPDIFAMVWGTEWYIRLGAPPRASGAAFETSLLAAPGETT
jgi:LmbE family N-acetylglucosaminyl deacetylase